MNLPPLLPSAVDPIAPNLSNADMYERALLTLDDETWENIEQIKLRESLAGDGPVVTGDPIVDELERKLWEERTTSG